MNEAKKGETYKVIDNVRSMLDRVEIISDDFARV